MSNPFDKIQETLSTVDNEGTESPYWLLIDPSPVIGGLVGVDEEGNKWVADFENEPHQLERLADAIPHCIEGPFFSREDAENYLDSRRYNYSKKAYVYCFSGYHSKKYKTACRQIGVGMKGKE